MVSDSFDRANSAVSLGDADTGQTWTARVGTWGISDNQAYEPGATAGAIATLDAEVHDCTVAVTVAVYPPGSGPEPGLYVVYVDADNWVRFVHGNDNNMYLQKRIGGSLSTVGSGAQVQGNDTDLSIVIDGASYSGLVGGVEKAAGTINDAAVAAATNHGIGYATAAGATSRLDDFSVTA